MEERIERIEERARQQEAANMTLLGVVRGIDGKVDELTGMARSVQAQEAIVDARLNAMNVHLDTHDRRLSTLDTRLQAHIEDTRASFGKVAEAQEQSEQRMEARFVEVNGRLDALETTVSELKEQVLIAFNGLLEAIKASKNEE